jgi:uncharacterized protein (DUF433 family)
LAQFNSDQTRLKQSIQELLADFSKLANMHINLKGIVRRFELGERIQAPFDFYFDLERSQRQVVLKLALKVEEAEKIAEQVLKQHFEQENLEQQSEH